MEICDICGMNFGMDDVSILQGGYIVCKTCIKDKEQVWKLYKDGVRLDKVITEMMTDRF